MNVETSGFCHVVRARATSTPSLLAHELVADLVSAVAGHELGAGQDVLAAVALGEELNREFAEIAALPHLVGHRFDHPLHETRVVGVAGQVDITAAYRER